MKNTNTNFNRRIRYILIAGVAMFVLFVAYKKIRYTDVSKPTNIAIQPMQINDAALLSVLIKQIESYYHIKTVLLSNIEMPKEAYYVPRQRYKANKIISFLKTQKPDSINYIIGITTKDISTSKGKIPDWGIMGLAYCPGKSAVVSTFRIITPNRPLLEERLTKIALHEIGHNFGLGHCDSKQCFMHAAEGSIKQVDAENLDMCNSCKEKIGL
jgi:archaemetzincin